MPPKGGGEGCGDRKPDDPRDGTRRASTCHDGTRLPIGDILRRIDTAPVRTRRVAPRGCLRSHLGPWDVLHRRLTRTSHTTDKREWVTKHNRDSSTHRSVTSRRGVEPVLRLLRLAKFPYTAGSPCGFIAWKLMGSGELPFPIQRLLLRASFLFAQKAAATPLDTCQHLYR